MNIFSKVPRETSKKHRKTPKNVEKTWFISLGMKCPRGIIIRVSSNGHIPRANNKNPSEIERAIRDDHIPYFHCKNARK